MTLLLKKDSTFVWNDNCELAFRELKEKLLMEPILQFLYSSSLLDPSSFPGMTSFRGSFKA